MRDVELYLRQHPELDSELNTLSVIRKEVQAMRAEAEALQLAVKALQDAAGGFKPDDPADWQAVADAARAIASVARSLAALAAPAPAPAPEPMPAPVDPPAG